MNTKSVLLSLLLSSLATLYACSNGELGNYVGLAMEGNVLKGLVVSYSTSDDSVFGGEEAVGISLIIENESSSMFDDCVFIINERYTASLKDVEYYFGFKKGNQPLGRSTINPKEVLVVQFSHDNNNHLIFKGDGGMFPRDEIIDRLTISSKKGAGTWLFKKVP